jgi:MAF protein
LTRLILASASPRRRGLLTRLGVDFEVRPVDIDESPGRSSNPEIVARRLAREKAEAARLLQETLPIIAADTVVAYRGELLGKPIDESDATRMLSVLRGQTHVVVSAVAVMPEGKRNPIIRHPSTLVTLRQYPDEQIAASIARGDPFDKAGGYAIQDPELRPISHYEGCYCNVVGMSLWATIDALGKAGIRIDPVTVDFLPECASCPLAWA